MNAAEIARKMAGLGRTADAIRAYSLVIHEEADGDPAAQLEAAAYILQMGGDYKISYTCFLSLYSRGIFREEILPLVTKVFYEPNIKMLKSRYERNCKALSRYPYLFRKDFVPFDELPIRFYPYDDHEGFIPFYVNEARFGGFINFRETVVSRNFFKDLEKPILATDVYSQYELEYLNDNVRKSEYVARENHIYLHYTDWGLFCSYLQCLNLRPLLKDEKFVFLIGDEVGQYPIDFKERFDIDYSRNPVRPIGIREINKLIWHTQLSTHNGGDFFNEVFDGHPNLICMPSLMMSSIAKIVTDARKAMTNCKNLREAIQKVPDWPPYLMEELYHMRDRTDKDVFVAGFLAMKDAVYGLDPDSRIAPALFFQPHFSNIIYKLQVDDTGRTILDANNYDAIHKSTIFHSFKYIKTFTPMRRFTSSHGATVKFMYESAAKTAEKKGEKKNVVSDAIMERVLNRSFMIDPDDRLYKDSILVRLEDGKLNPKATFTALAAFLDIPYDECMTYCSEGGKPSNYTKAYDGNGFNPASVYRTYNEYVNHAERYFIEYFLRDAYEYYGYSFQHYDGAPVDEERCKELIQGFTVVNGYMRKTWLKVFREVEVSQNSQRVDAETEERIQDKLLDDYMERFDKNRLASAKILLKGLHFVNKNGQPLYMMPRLEPDPALLEQPLYH